MELDPAVCERARLSRDARFDGRFFIAVITTGVYCRPVCSVRPPRSKNVIFMSSAAAAAEAGFRPCLRCRPETSPGTPAWLGTSATVSRALRLIGDGVLDRGSVEDLAAKLGMGSRHLHRLFVRHLGASPLSVAQTRRLHFAKKLLDETDLPMAQVALSAGFSSVRRFNSVVRDTYDRSPSDLRAARRKRRGSDSEVDGFRVRLPYRKPFDWGALLAFLSERAIPGVECVADGHYRRSICMDGDAGVLDVTNLDEEGCLSLNVRLPNSLSLLRVTEGVKRLFDVGADPHEIAAHLGSDRLLAKSIAKRPGLRVPGAWDPFELCVRAILGQQVSVRGASTLAGRIAERFGSAIVSAADGDPSLLFPSAEALHEADFRGLGLTRARENTILCLARAVCDGSLSLEVGAPLEERIEELTALPGIGVWTAQYVAMRAFGEPDAFPVGDLALAKAATAPGEDRVSPRTLAARSEQWRPWRAYAAMHLWSSLGDSQTLKRRPRGATGEATTARALR